MEAKTGMQSPGMVDRFRKIARDRLGAGKEALSIPYRDVLLPYLVDYDLVFTDADLLDASCEGVGSTTLTRWTLTGSSDELHSQTKADRILVCRGKLVGKVDPEEFYAALIYTDKDHFTVPRAWAMRRLHQNWVLAGPEPLVESAHTRVLENVDAYSLSIHPDWTQFLRSKEADLAIKHLERQWRILEIGSGDGYIARLLGAKGFSVCATDVSPRFPQYVDVTEVTPGKLPFPDGSFDAVISFHVLEHIEELDRAFAEMRRVLRPGGVMVHVLPSTALIVLSMINQPIAYVKHAWVAAFGKRARLLGRGVLGAIRRTRLTAKRLNVIRIAWGPSHGVYTRIRALKEWRVESWTRRFEQYGLNVKNIEGLSITYSLNKVVPFFGMAFRRYLASHGMPGSYSYHCELKPNVSRKLNSPVSSEVSQLVT